MVFCVCIPHFAISRCIHKLCDRSLSGVSSQFACCIATMRCLALLVALLGVLTPSLGQKRLPTGEVSAGGGGCATEDMEQDIVNTFMDGIQEEVLQNIVPSLQCRVGQCMENPAMDCQDVLNQGTGSSGWYYVRTCTGDTARVYCAMENPCGCNVTGAWMRIGLLNMSDPTVQCPSGMGLIASPRSCSRNVQPGACTSFFFESNSVQYSRVCGRAIGYSESSPDAFRPYNDNQYYTIDDTYVDGISVTYGFSPRKHIWTFAAGVEDTGTDTYRCPCTSPNYAGVTPPYIGNDWFCEAGPVANWQAGTIYSDNPLWDGMGCQGSESTCCTANNPPWFCKDLTEPTEANIEVRACGDQHQNDEDVLVQLVEMYVQ